MWSAHLFAGGARLLRSGGLGADVAVGGGVARSIGPKTRFGLGLEYQRLGSLSTVLVTRTPPPALDPGTMRKTDSQNLVHFGPYIEHDLGSGPIQPALLGGLGVYGFEATHRAVGTDDTTGDEYYRSETSGWHWGGGLSAGVGIGVVGLLGPITPRLEGNVHLAVTKGQEGWTSNESLTFGLGLLW